MNKHEIFIIKANEYLNKVVELNRNVKKNDGFTFFDNKSMYFWRRGNDRKLVDEYRKDIIPSEERLEEIMLYARIYDELYKSKKIRIGIYESKILQYFIKVSEFQRNIDEVDNIRFSDNTSMYDWYKDEEYKLLEERKNNIIPTRERMEEIMLFASLEKFINEIDNKNYIKYSKKVDEYMMQIKKLGRNINSSDNICFSDSENMFDWYQNESSKIKAEISNQKTYSEFRIYEVILFAQVENLLYDIKVNKLKKLSLEILKLRNPSTNNYETLLEKYARRCEEYYELIEDLGRNLNKYDEEYFSDGINMFKWHEREYNKFINEDKNNIELSEKRKIERKLFFKIIEKTNKYSIYEPSFEQKCDEYIKLIKKLGRNIKQNDKFYFKNTIKDMYSWFIYYDQKLNRRRNILEKPEGEIIEKLMCFAKIYDELYEQRRLKLSNK